MWMKNSVELTQYNELVGKFVIQENPNEDNDAICIDF